MKGGCGGEREGRVWRGEGREGVEGRGKGGCGGGREERVWRGKREGRMWRGVTWVAGEKRKAKVGAFLSCYTSTSWVNTQTC